MALTLKKNFGFALFGNLGYAASQYVILLIFIKLFSMEDVGQFVFAGAFTTPLMMALEMQLRNFYVTDHSGENSFSDYITYRTLTSLLGVVGLIIVAYFFKPEYFIVIVIVTLIKTFEAQLDLVYAIYQKQHQLNYVAYSRIIRGIVAIIVVALVSYIFENIIYSLLAYFIAWVCLYFFYERKEVVRRGFITDNELKLVKLTWSKFKYFIIICFPVFCAIYIDKYYLNYPRISVERLLGIEALAVFGSLLYFKSLGGQFITAVAQSAMPRLADYVRLNKRRNFITLITKMVLVGVLIGGLLVLMAWLFGPSLLTILYTSQYAKYSDVLLIVLVGTMVTFCYTFVTSAFTAIRKQWIRLPVSIFMLGFMAAFFYFTKINSLLDVAYIVLYCEIINLVIFYILFIIFINRFFNKSVNSEQYESSNNSK